MVMYSRSNHPMPTLKRRRIHNGVGLINMNVLFGLGDDITQSLTALENQSGGAIKAFRSDFPLTSERSAVLAVMQRIQDTLDWAPRTLVSVAQTMMDQYQTFPLLRSYKMLGIALPSRPDWLQDSSNLDGWQTVYEGYKPIATAFTSKEMAAVVAEGQKLASNANFWDNVAEYSGVAKLQELWGKFWDSITALKTNRVAAKTGIDTAKDIIAKYGTKVPQQYVSATDAAQSAYDSATSKAMTLLAPLGSQVKAEAGLGALPLIIAGIAAATLIAITAGVWLVVNEFTSIQRQANANANDMLKWRDAQDAADFTAGKITNADLMARRQQSVAAATEIVKNQGAAQIGNALKDAGSGLGTSLGITFGVVALLGVGAYFLVKKLK